MFGEQGGCFFPFSASYVAGKLLDDKIDERKNDWIFKLMCTHTHNLRKSIQYRTHFIFGNKFHFYFSKFSALTLEYWLWIVFALLRSFLANENECCGRWSRSAKKNGDEEKGFKKKENKKLNYKNDDQKCIWVRKRFQL